MYGNKYIVDESGEIIEELGRSKIIHESQLKYITETSQIKMPFVKFNPKVIKELKNLKNTLILLDYIDYKTNVLVYKNGKVIRKVKDLGKLLSTNEKVGYRKVNELLKDDVICKYREDGRTVFLFNPYIAHIGKRINKIVIEEFKKSKWRAFSDEY